MDALSRTVAVILPTDPDRDAPAVPCRTAHLGEKSIQVIDLIRILLLGLVSVVFLTILSEPGRSDTSANRTTSCSKTLFCHLSVDGGEALATGISDTTPMPPFKVLPTRLLPHPSGVEPLGILRLSEDKMPKGGKHPMATYYVDVNGNNSGTGSESSPFRTIQFALDRGLDAGDVIIVRPGTYREALYINDGGSAAGNVTLKAEVPGSVLLLPPSGSWNGISVNANYVTIQGFEIANANGDGIEANNVHHIKVLDNVVHGSGESGIQFNWSEFIVIERNTTYENASDGWFSGISVYQNRNITGDTTTPGFRTIIRDNTSYDNITKTGNHTDGNGIIIDDFQSTQTGGFPSYTFPTLVENNLVYQNGGKGIQVVWSDGVTVRNNTAWHNNQDPLNSGTWRGEISNSQSSNNIFVNNIAVVDPSVNPNNRAIDSTSYGGYQNENVIWANNLTFTGTAGQASVRTDGGNAGPSASNGNLLGVDPEFIAAPSDFRLTETSAAVDAGTSNFGGAAADLDGAARVVGTVDLGAYEAGSVRTVTPAPLPEPTPAPEPDLAPKPTPTPEPSPLPDDTGDGLFSIWDETAQPAIAQDSDTEAVTLGLRFTADIDASLLALNVYVSGANAGAQSIAIWSGNGILIAEATTESVASGWQTIAFNAPVALEAGQDYVVSYCVPDGQYAASGNFFQSASDAGPISLDANAGVYSYGQGNSFPDQSYNASNYWVDVVLVADAPESTAARDAVIGEASVAVVDQTMPDMWHKVIFETALDNPSVVMGGFTANGSQPYSVQVRNVTDMGFEFQIDEWDYLDGVHTTESISWLAVESGTHKLEDGRVIEAGQNTIGGVFASVGFATDLFIDIPILLAQSVGDANAMTVTDRLRDITASGFEARLFQQEATLGTIAEDRFDWIAVEAGGSATDGAVAETTGRAINHKAAVIDFEGAFETDAFALLTDMQSTFGGDTATVRTVASDLDTLTVMILEEASYDKEMRHTTEDVGLVGFDIGLILGTTVYDNGWL